MQEARDVIDAPRRRGRGRVRRHDRLRRPCDDVHPARRMPRGCRRTCSPRHAAGVGRPFPREVVRAMLLLRANTLALGHSGCRPLLVDRICELPRAWASTRSCPEQGSVGASGDLAPLAHLALPLIGRGEVELGGQVMPALVALREAGLEPLDARAQGGPGAAQRHAADERARGAARSPTRERLAPDGVGRGGDVGRGAARHGGRVRRALPAGAAAPGPGRRGRRAAAPAARFRAPARPTTARRTRSRTRTRCAACRRSTAPSATRSTTCAACSTSSSTPRPTTRSSSRSGGAVPERRRSRPAAAS